VITGANEDDSNTSRVWVAGFHHVTACSLLARILKLTYRLFIFQLFFGLRQIADTVSVAIGARLYFTLRYLATFMAATGTTLPL
jgi:hypothetical protein